MKGSSKESSSKKHFDARFSFPTREESIELRRTVLSTDEEENASRTSVVTILNSNLWDLQTKELLDEVTVDYRMIKWIENKLREIRGAITNLNVRNPITSSSESAAYPLHSQRKVELEDFVKPSRVAVIGSFLLRSIAKPRVNIDLAVFIPSSTFIAKDLRDHRYTDKRNLYLKTMANALRKEEPTLFHNMWYEALNGDTRRPVLCVGISKDMNKKTSSVAVRIVPALDPKDSPFDPKRLDLLNPRNNCRRRVVGEIQESQPITPHYTNAVLEDLSLESNLRHLHARSKNSRTFSLACVLIKIWLRQRGLDSISDGVNGFMMSMLMSHLFQDTQRVLSSQMGIFQIFRTFMTWLSKQTTLCVDMSSSSSSPTSSKFLNDMFDTVCMSPSFEITHQETTTTKVLRLNIFARVSKYAFEELRYQAKRTLTMFAPGSDPMIGIQNIFVRRADVLCRKDLVFWIKAPKSPPSPPKNLDSMEELRRDSSKAAQRKLRLLENARARSIRTHNAVCDFGWKRVYADAVSDVITQGMGDRAYRVHATYDAAQTWSSKLENDFRVCVQIDLNPDNAWECVQKGPSAEDKIASREFRSFWGKKSELRRFHDGTMLESVVWSCGDKDKSLDWQHRVPEMIVRHLMSRHFPTSHISKGMSESFRFWENHHSVRSDALNLFEVFTKLEKKLKSLPRHAMPLHVTQVRPMGPSFRYTASCEKHPMLNLDAYDEKEENDLDRMPVPMEAVIRLESSAQWPDDVDAIRQTKAAFFLRLSKALKEHYNIFSRVSRAEPQSHMDVCFEGFVFRFWMSQQREVHLLKKQSRVEELQSVRAQLYHRPHVTSLLRAVADQHRVFPETAMLMKTWFSIHGLLNVHVNENLIELITAYVFSRTDASSSAPQDTSAAFLRVLDLLANYDWQGLPLIVDPQSHLKPRHRRFVQESLDRDRARKSPEYAMYVVAAPESSELKTWGVVESNTETPRRHIVPFFSKSRPSSIILKRIVSLARASLCVLRNAFESRVNDEEMAGRVATLFASSDDDFDLVVRLRPESESLKRAETVLLQGTSIQPASKRRRTLLKESKFRNMKRNVSLNAAKECQRVAGFAPLRLLARSVESRLRGIALCFWNDQDLSSIGIVFRPDWLKSKEFKLMTLMARMPQVLKSKKTKKKKKRTRDQSEETTMTIPNMSELISDIKALGRGMVIDVEVSSRIKKNVI